MNWRWWTAAALGVFGLWSALMIAQRPGLQYDEALLVAGSVVLRHPAVMDALPKHPDTWTCVGKTCFPLMAEDRYIGAVKEYLILPLFAVFGNKAGPVRLLSVLLAMVGLWGIAKFLAEQASPRLGVAAAFALAIHPSYLTMNVFDNGAVAATMAALGLCCASLSAYLLKRTAWAAFWMGAAAGFGIWTRANFIWTLAAMVLAIVLVLRRQAFPPWKHVGAMVFGGVFGGFPFLWFQIVSGGGTYKAIDTLRNADPWSSLLPYRYFMLKEVLVVDGEHLVMWGSTAVPDWQLQLFLLLTAASCVIAILLRKKKGERWPVAQAAAWVFLILTALLFSTRTRIAEHHLIAVVPLAVVVVVLAAAILHTRFARGWIVTAMLIATYGATALYWDVKTVQGLRTTGGLGVWSDAINRLTPEVQAMEAGRYTKVLDWGFMENLFVLSDGAIRAVEVGDPGNPTRSSLGRTWPDEIREGGLFLLSGTGNRSFPGPVAEFQKALAGANPVIERQTTIVERSGISFAHLLDIRPNSIGQGSNESSYRGARIEMADPASDKLLTGFYSPEAGGWRWTTRHFSATFKSVVSMGGDPWLVLEGYIPDTSIQRLGPMTLAGKVGANRLEPATYDKAGNFTYSRKLNPEWFYGGTATLEFDLDKWVPPSPPPGDSRELGVVIRSVNLEIR